MVPPLRGDQRTYQVVLLELSSLNSRWDGAYKLSVKLDTPET